MLLEDGLIVILSIVAAAICSFPVVFWVLNRLYAEKTCQAAKDLEIGDGVTLAQGVLAFFGTEGGWVADWKSAIILAGGQPGPLAYLRCEPKKGRVEVVRYFLDGIEVEPCESQALVGQMVQAAREQRGGAPW